MTTLTETTDVVGVETHPDGMPVIKKTAVAAEQGNPTQSDHQPNAEALRPPRDWWSGFCTGGSSVGTGCTDGSKANKVGEPIRRCLYIAVNGDKAPHKFLYCACACHDERRVPEDPHFKPGN